MKRKATQAFVVGAAFVTFIFVLGAYAMAQQPMKLKMTSFLPPPEVSMLAEIAKVWQEEVTKQTKGNLTFENYWGGAMASPA